MSLVPGSRLGPYEVVSAIGAGGMGEVYRARDTRLDRDVAIKVLPAHLADDPQFRERFEREAKTIAALNHPHICVLHDVGHESGTDFLVLEHLEGETLAARIARGPLPVQDSLAIAIQIADALDKAHRAGIVHRDLKPGNIFLVRGGSSGSPTAKLLDFGLAKTRGGVGLQARDVTAQAPLTAQGTILGTFQYMAPEQIEGSDADSRSDIFALGVVLYEMLTGKRAFDGKTTASLIAAILGAEPPALSSFQPLTPPALERAARRCLEKDPDDRWQSARDLLAELRWIAEGGAALAGAQPPRPDRRRERVLWAAALLVAAAATGAGGWLSRRPAPTSSRPLARFALTPDVPVTGFNQNMIALSPDGSKLVYVGQVPAPGQQLFLRSLDQLDPVPVRGAEGALGPFFSPDGQWIGFVAGGKLKKVPVSGGAALAIADATNVRGAFWAPDDAIYFGSGDDVVRRVPGAGGAVTTVTSRDPKVEVSHRWPHMLPGGRAMLFTPVRTMTGDMNAATIDVARLDTGERRTLITGGFAAQYAPSGHIVFMRAGTLLAVPFDLERLEVTGSPAPVVESVQASAATGAAQFAISATGTLAYVPGGQTASDASLVWVDRRGVETPIPGRPGAYQELDLSPDGTRVAVNIGINVAAVGGVQGDVWIHQLARGTLTRFTFGPYNESPVWSPDGTRIAYASQRENNRRFIFVKPADSSGPEVKVGEKDGHIHVASWSPRGDVIALDETQGTSGDVWLLRLADQKVEPFLRSPFTERGAAFSPDGRWIAYTTNESGRTEVYAQAFPGPGGRWQISTDGGAEPIWARNGRELFYRNGDKMMAVPIEAGGSSLSAGNPSLLFEGRYAISNNEPYYDVAPDGQRFLMLKPNAAGASASIILVQEWTRELERLVPTTK